jgi:hypothetical protein
MARGGHVITGRIVAGVTVASDGRRAPTGDLSGLRPGRAVQVLGAWRPSDGAVDVARFTLATEREAHMATVLLRLLPEVTPPVLAW